MTDDPWGIFGSDMLDLFGRRDPECVWCGQTVYMALQTAVSGGVWTTEEADEGPYSEGLNDPGTRCPESPDGEHSCFATEKWLNPTGE